MSQINIGGLTIDKFYLGNSDSVQIYLGNVKLYPQSTPPTPVSSCYEIIPQPISQYASTTYDSVYSWSDAKWYMKNNLSQYEEYGVYDVVENISSATTYDGKLAVVGTTEYEYSGGSWVVVGTYEDASTTYEITDEDPYEYEGVELSTTFKIPTADIEALGGWLDFRIRTSDGGNLNIGTDRYYYMGNSYIEGTVTNDNDYFYYSLPDIDSVVIQQIEYWDSTPIHLIVGSKQASVEYSAKTTPSSALTYSSVADMEAVSCPTVGVGQYCYTNEQIYKFASNEEWVAAQDSEIMMFALDGSGNTRILACGYNSGDIPKNAAFDFTAVEAYFGHCVTSIGENLFYSMYDKLKSISATSVVPPITIDWAFGSNLSNLKIYVPCSSVHTYRTSKGWKTYANIIDSNEPNCQIESFKARFYDANNNLIGELQRTYDANGTNITSAETQSYASSTYRVELGDAFVRIQDSAFKGFSHITNLSIGNNVIFVGSNFVSGCTALQTLEFPSDYGAYFNTNLIGSCDSLKKITIPSGTGGIYRSSIYNCYSLQSITILTPNVLSFWDSSGTVFPNTNNCPIYVPANLINNYKSASGWNTVASRIQAIPNS